jgi:hypothetical protein
MKRRNFLKTSSVIAAASLLPGKLLLADSQKSIGLQLYTIRKDINQDLEGSLKRVAEIGYKTVELASYDKGKFYGKSPAEFKSMLADLGLQALSTHNGFHLTTSSRLLKMRLPWVWSTSPSLTSATTEKDIGRL